MQTWSCIPRCGACAPSLPLLLHTAGCVPCQEAAEDVAKLHRDSEQQAGSPVPGSEKARTKTSGSRKRRRAAGTVSTPKMEPKKLKFPEPEAPASEDDPEHEDGEDDDDDDEEGGLGLDGFEDSGDDDLFREKFALKDRVGKQVQAIEDKPKSSQLPAIEDKPRPEEETPEEEGGLGNLPRDLGNKLKKINGDLLETLTGDFGPQLTCRNEFRTAVP